MAKSEKTLLDLPLELIENVLSFMDGETLIMCGYTCKMLQTIINGPNIRIKEVWKKVCFNEIPEDYCLEILLNLYPRYWISDINIKWNIIYSTWKKWKQLPEWYCSTKVVDIQDYEISCLCVSGAWLLIGTKNRGSLSAYNLKTKRKKSLFKGADVLGMQVYCLSDSLNYEYIEDELILDNTDELLPGAAHDEVLLYVEVQYDVLINIRSGSSKIIPRSSGLYQFRRFENKEVTVNQNVVECLVKITNGKANENIVRKFVGMPFWQILDLWKNKIVLMDWSGALLLLDHNLRTIPHSMNEIVIDTSCSIQTSRIRAVRVFHWHGKVGMQILNTLSRHEMRIFISGKSVRYFPFQELDIHVQSVLYSSGILYLGTDLGSVLAYLVKDDDALLDLDLRNFTWQKEIGQEPVLTLALKQTTDKPTLFASTSHSVYQIDFSEQRHLPAL